MSTQSRLNQETTQGLVHPQYISDGQASPGSEQKTNGHVKTSGDNNGLIIENPAHRLTPEVANALDARRVAHNEALAIAQEPTVTREIRRELSESRLRTIINFTGAPNNIETLKGELRDGALKRSDQISVQLSDRIKRGSLRIADLFKWSDQMAVQPEPVDHSFWWARTDATAAPATRAEFRDDGLHFFGGPKVNDYNGSMDTSFGAVARFALQPQRFPTSPSGLVSSSPHVELCGGVVASAPEFDLIQGDGIAECRLFLRQTIFQFGFGPTGPVPLVVADARVIDDWHIRLVNLGASRHADLPGFKPLPSVTYNQNNLRPGELHAEIEVRFDIHLNCTGALVWCDPEVLLRTFQWEPTPV